MRPVDSIADGSSPLPYAATQSKSETSSVPHVTVILACRNEARHIGRCIESILANDYPKEQLEILIVDGQSEDDTRGVIQFYTRRYSCCRLLENPRRTTQHAFNLGVTEATGDFIIIMGAHSTYAPDYISKSVAYSARYGADNVGGIIKPVPGSDTLMAAAIAAALSHPFGVGNSYFRTWRGADPIWVDTVFGGCYRRDVFSRIGLFNGALARSQDIEFNLRLKRSGGRILLVPSIVSYYHARSNFVSFARHNFSNGLWAILPFARSKTTPVSLRHLIPLLFVVSMLTGAFIALFFSRAAWGVLTVAMAYLAANLVASAHFAWRERRGVFIFILPPVFTMLHVGYGIGSLWGCVKMIPLLWDKQQRSESQL